MANTDFADFSWLSEGTIGLLTPLTPEAREWLSVNVNNEESTYWGQALVVESGYAQAILDGISADGFAIMGAV